MKEQQKRYDEDEKDKDHGKSRTQKDSPENGGTAEEKTK
jgi:hypothetical protein